MILWDKLCRVAEFHFPGMLESLRLAKLFNFDISIEQKNAILEANSSPETFSGLFLPYKQTAVNIAGKLLLVEDPEDGMVGSRLTRRFVLVEHAPSFRYGELEGLSYEEIAFIENAISMCIGVIGFEDRQEQGENGPYINYIIRGKVYKRVVASNRGCEDIEDFVEYDASPEDKIKLEENIKLIDRDTLSIAREILICLHTVNHPDNFILETTPVEKYKKGKVKNKAKKPKKLLRSHQRPTYTILHPNKIQEKLGIRKTAIPTTPSEKRKKKSDYPVRAHINYLSKRRYRFDANGMEIEPKVIPSGNRKGELYYKTSFTPAYWVGESEKRVGNKVYRVILDR